MKIILAILLFFLSSCTNVSLKNNLDYDFDLNKDISFEEFKLRLDEYVKNKSYPNINN